MKKLLALLLALAMVFALAACGGSETPAEEAPAEEAGAESTYTLGLGVVSNFDSSAAGKKIAYTSASEVSQAVEQRSARPDGGRPHQRSAGHLQRDAFCHST